MSIGSSQSRSSTTSNAPEDLTEVYRFGVREILNKRYKELSDAKSASNSIAERYDLTIAIAEVKEIYNLIFKETY